MGLRASSPLRSFRRSWPACLLLTVCAGRGPTPVPWTRGSVHLQLGSEGAVLAMVDMRLPVVEAEIEGHTVRQLVFVIDGPARTFWFSGELQRLPDTEH